MFNDSSHIDASHSTFNEVHQDQYCVVQATVQGNQTNNTIVYGNQIYQSSHLSLFEVLQKASAPNATHNSVQRYPAPKCIEGTRIELLNRLTLWIDDPNQKPICWLNGRPGSGKSAISQSIAELYAKKERLAASFFFSRKDVTRCTIRYVVPTLVMQLLVSLPSIRPAIITALENDYMIPTKVLREQMEKLLFGPVSRAIEVPKAPLVIVIDALDECDEEKAVLELVSLFAVFPQKISFPLRLLVTSRPEPWLQSRFRQQDIAALTLSLETHTFSAEKDIRLFLRRALADVYEEHLQVMKDVPRPWPSGEELDRIVSKADGLFVFALTVVKFVGDRMHNPVERLRTFLENKNSTSIESAYSDLDSLYRDAISVVADPHVTRLVLGIIYCTAIPLSITGLHKLLQRPDVDVRIVVPALGSILLTSEDGKQPVQFHHASFRDFLANPKRSQNFAVDPNVYHELLAQRCLQTMSDLLRRDMCGIGDPSKANKEVPNLVQCRQAAYDDALSYACHFWSRHLARLPKNGIAAESLLDPLKKFSTTVLLHWVEALSIFNEVESAVMMLREAISWLKTLQNAPKDTLTLLENADCLVALCMEPISQCALHVYITALSFAPRNSPIYRTFEHQSYGTLDMHPDRENWDVVRTDLDLHHPALSVVFSPDDKMVATAGASQGVQLWNTITGKNMASFGDSSSTSLLVSFSPSGAFLAAAFEGGTVAVWDPIVGREHLKHENCHSQPITCIEFSKNSVLLVSGARDRTIQVWSLDTALPLFRLTLHGGPLTSLVFSVNSSRSFSGSEDNQIFVWDMSNGGLVFRMMGHRNAVNCIALSRDGSIIASGSEDKTVKLWDTSSGKCIQTFSKGHRTGIRAVHFFNEHIHLITACDEAILLWSVAAPNKPITMWTQADLYKQAMMSSPVWQARLVGSAVPSCVLGLMIHGVNAVGNFSPAAKRLRIAFATQSPSLVFTSLSFTFISPLQALPNSASLLHMAYTANAIAISSDSRWAVIADFLGSLQILDLTVPQIASEILENSVRHEKRHGLNPLIPSPLGTRFIVCGIPHWRLMDENLCVIKNMGMGIGTGMPELFRGENKIQFKFSPDGSIFVCVTVALLRGDRNILSIFDSATGKQRAQFPGLRKVQSFVASIGGAWVACGGMQGQVSVLGVASGQRTSMAALDDSPVHSLCFSDDAQTLVGGFANGVVRVWDRASGVCKVTFTESTSTVNGLAYAEILHGGAGDACVAVGREDGSVCVWFPSRSVSHDILVGEQATVKKVDIVRFSNDGMKLTSRCEDGTVFHWAIAFQVGAVANTVHCTVCSSARWDQGFHGAADGGGSSAASSTVSPHLLSQFDPEEIVDNLLHTAYRVDKDGWLVKGSRRVIWLPPTNRPSGKDEMWAYENGLVVFYTAARKLVALRWIDRQ